MLDAAPMATVSLSGPAFPLPLCLFLLGLRQWLPHASAFPTYAYSFSSVLTRLAPRTQSPSWPNCLFCADIPSLIKGWRNLEQMLPGQYYGSIALLSQTILHPLSSLLPLLLQLWKPRLILDNVVLFGGRVSNQLLKSNRCFGFFS